MAKLSYDGLDAIAEPLSKLEGSQLRKTVKDIVYAGAHADAYEWNRLIHYYHHVRTGEMVDSVNFGQYRETMGGGEVDVYPQDTDSKGVRNALKAYVINYGRGNKRSERMGDKFITSNEKAMEEAVSEAMAAEADAALRNLGL